MSGSPESRPTAPSGENPVSVHWDDSNMRSDYSNVCNVTGTREEIILLFGVHQAWQSGAKDLRIQLRERLIMTPYAAKRLHLLLARVIREYENRYGTLPMETSEQGGLAERLPTS